MKMKSIKVMLAGLMVFPMIAFSVALFNPFVTSVSAVTCSDGSPAATEEACPPPSGLQGGANAARGTDTPKKLFGGDSSVFKVIANTALFIIGAVSVIMLIYGGIRYTTSGGNEKSVTAAKDTILYAVVGIIVAIMAYAVVNFVITSFTG